MQANLIIKQFQDLCKQAQSALSEVFVTRPTGIFLWQSSSELP